MGLIGKVRGRLAVLLAVLLLGGGSVTAIAVTAGSASAAPAAISAASATKGIPPGYTEVGGLDEAGYCASATPSMTAVIDSNNTTWDCSLTVSLPAGKTRTLTFELNQTDACDAQYPSDAGTEGAVRIPASPPAYGWICVVPSS
jgi:hypothetical protein